MRQSGQLRNLRVDNKQGGSAVQLAVQVGRHMQANMGHATCMPQPLTCCGMSKEKQSVSSRFVMDGGRGVPARNSTLRASMLRQPRAVSWLMAGDSRSAAGLHICSVRSDCMATSHSVLGRKPEALSSVRPPAIPAVTKQATVAAR